MFYFYFSRICFFIKLLVGECFSGWLLVVMVVEATHEFHSVHRRRKEKNEN